MSVKLFIGAAITALIALFNTAPATIAQRILPSEDRISELSGRITAVEADAIHIQVDGGDELLVRTGEQTEIQTLHPQGDVVVKENLTCVARERPADESDLLVGVRVRILVEDENGVVSTTIIIVPKACWSVYQPRDGAGTLPPPPVREPQTTGETGD